jgi:Cu2+-containing amine oxidase
VASKVKKKQKKKLIDPELSDTVKSAENILTNAKTFIEATKRTRTDETRITMNVVTASIGGKKLKVRLIWQKRLVSPIVGLVVG